MKNDRQKRFTSPGKAWVIIEGPGKGKRLDEFAEEQRLIERAKHFIVETHPEWLLTDLKSTHIDDKGSHWELTFQVPRLENNISYVVEMKKTDCKILRSYTVE